MAIFCDARYVCIFDHAVFFLCAILHAHCIMMSILSSTSMFACA